MRRPHRLSPDSHGGGCCWRPPDRVSRIPRDRREQASRWSCAAPALSLPGRRPAAGDGARPGMASPARSAEIDFVNCVALVDWRHQSRRDPGPSRRCPRPPTTPPPIRPRTIACTIGGNVAEELRRFARLKYGMIIIPLLGREMVLDDRRGDRLGGRASGTRRRRSARGVFYYLVGGVLASSPRRRCLCAKPETARRCRLASLLLAATR